MSWLTNKDSITRYTEALRHATTDDETFKKFRREAGVREIVEGVPDVVGRGYHDKITKLVGVDELNRMWERVTKNDKVGDPALVELTPHGRAASTTMRYLWNVLDMQQHGVKLDDACVVEIGGGYGGLCRMIHEFHKPISYTIIDLPEATALAKRYLAMYDIEPTFVSCHDYKQRRPIDTFISNYALTELSKDTQHEYVNHLMKYASYGYVTFNSQPRDAANQYSLSELQKFVPGTSIVEDENVKKSECKVLIWTS